MRPSIRTLLFSVNLFLLLVPLSAFLVLRLYDTHLIEQTERQLIAEAVLIGEAWREAWLSEQGLTPETTPDIRPPNAPDPQFFPPTPMLTDESPLADNVLQPATRFAPRVETTSTRAGRAITPMLMRAQRMNLSGVRVLDDQGCVIATTANDLLACLNDLPEVSSALTGQYTAVARRRLSDEPPPALSSLSRRGRTRVFVANPIFSAGRVVGVVRVGRTSIDPLEALWFHRRLLAWALAISLLLTVGVSVFLAYAISRPVATITAAAERIAHGGRAEGFAASAVAPDEVARLAQALSHMAQELTSRADYIAQFALNVSHELKNPLAGIRGAVELLKDSWETMAPEQRQRFLSNIDVDASYLQRLATRLLELARIQNAPEKTSELAIPAFLEQLVARYGERVRLVLQTPPSTITMNAEHLEAALRNLLDNAVRYGSPKPVSVTASRDGQFLRLDVRDQGPGISEANQKKLFTRFFTTERDRGGTGLGLAMVKAVADTRGGSVNVVTGPEGSTFTLRL